MRNNKVLAAGVLSIAAMLTINTALANAPVAETKSEAKINQASPVKRVPPSYPEKAAQQNVEGFVVLSFDITETGATDNVKVVKSVPAGVFDKSAKVALNNGNTSLVFKVQRREADRPSGAARLSTRSLS